MIPRRLRLHNFLSYRDCTIDFTPLHVAVLTGKNGHGKSAILDAMTWALWNKARGGGDEERIRQGTDDMLVDLEFEVEGQIYRVVRRRTRGKTAAVDFFLIDADGLQVPMAGRGVRETDAEIERVVGLDYTTFMNSAFVAQGRSGEFMTRRPGERKEILGRILGLERYDLYANEAKNRRTDSKTNVASIERQIGHLEEQVEALPSVRTAFETAERLQRELEPRIASAEQDVQGLRQAADAFEALERDVREASERLGQLEDRCRKAESDLQQTVQAINRTAETLARRKAIEERYARFIALRQEDEALMERRERWQSAQRAAEQAGAAIETEQARLETERKNLLTQHAEAERDAARLEQLAAREQELAAAEREIANEQQAIDALRAAVQQLREDAARFEAEQAGSLQRAEDLKKRQLQLEDADGALCPVCRQTLSEHDAERLREEYRIERKRLGEDYREAEARAKETAAQAERQTADLRTREQALARRERDVRQQQKELHAALERARLAGDRITAFAAEIGAIEKTLVDGAYAPDAREALAAAQRDAADIGYDEEAHRTVRRQAKELEDAEEDRRALDRAMTETTILEQQRANLERDLGERRQDVADAGHTLQERRERLAATEDVHPRLQEAERVLDGLRSEERDLLGKIGSLKQQVATLERLEAQLETERDNLIAAREEEEIYLELATAFGRSGVQALLIDHSLPRIAEHANDLLRRMSGEGIQVDLTTQAETKSETVRETLEIIIRDGRGGERDYDLYSGGERFRVDLALRIALSRLLAERAGAPLPTLIIDEGFGTQDEEGVSRLLEAINAVSDEFELVLIVTHLDEMKEFFRHRIDITKTLEQGSVATVTVAS